MVVGDGVVVASYGEPLINTLSCMTVSLITIVNSGNEAICANVSV